MRPSGGSLYHRILLITMAPGRLSCSQLGTVTCLLSLAAFPGEDTLGLVSFALSVSGKKSKCIDKAC